MNGHLEANGTEGTTVITLTKVGKVLAWAGAVAASLLAAQFFAFRAFAAADRAQLREELGAQIRSEISSAMSKVMTQSDKMALEQRIDFEQRQLQRQIDENRRLLDQHLEKFQANLK